MVRDESLNILFAARDTTSSLLTFVAYLLMDNPEVENRMRQEVLDICGPDRAPTIADIKKMKYSALPPIHRIETDLTSRGGPRRNTTPLSTCTVQHQTE